MTIPIWMAGVAAVGIFIGGGGASAVLVAYITARNNAQTSLPAHLNEELRRLSSDRERDRNRLDALEAHLVLLGDHVDILEQHIWKELPPPPPARPVFHPYRSDSA